MEPLKLLIINNNKTSYFSFIQNTGEKSGKLLLIIFKVKLMWFIMLEWTILS